MTVPAGRQARFLGELSQGEGRIRRFVRRLDHHRAAGRQCRGGLAGDHGRRKIPRRDGRTDPDRLLQHENPTVALVRGNHVAVDPFSLFSKPLDADEMTQMLEATDTILFKGASTASAT